MTFPSPMNRLPSGAMFEREGEAWLIRDGRLHRWSFDGYLRTDLPITDEPVKVLTPVSIVRAFELGLVPQVHPSCSE